MHFTAVNYFFYIFRYTKNVRSSSFNEILCEFNNGTYIFYIEKPIRKFQYSVEFILLRLNCLNILIDKKKLVDCFKFGVKNTLL